MFLEFRFAAFYFHPEAHLFGFLFQWHYHSIASILFSNSLDAQKRLGIKLEDIKLLSIGTGIGNKYYSQKSNFWNNLLGWGFLAKWDKTKFIDMILNLQSQTSSNMAGLLLNPNQILRINFKSDTKLSLDDPMLIDDLVSKADKDFSHNSTKIKEFLNL